MLQTILLLVFLILFVALWVLPVFEFSNSESILKSYGLSVLMVTLGCLAIVILFGIGSIFMALMHPT